MDNIFSIFVNVVKFTMKWSYGAVYNVLNFKFCIMPFREDDTGFICFILHFI